MRRPHQPIDYERADVYSLAKTLWVLLAGFNMPFPGQHQADDDSVRLTARLDSPLTTYLDLLIERCTRNDPQRRPQLREVAMELDAMLQPRSETTTESDVNDVKERIAARIERHRRQENDRNKFHERCSAAVSQLMEVTQKHFFELAAYLPDFNTRHPADFQSPTDMKQFPSIYSGHNTWGGMISAPGEGRVWVSLGASISIMDLDGRCRIGIVIRVNRHNNGRGHEVTTVEQVMSAVISMASFEQAVTAADQAFASATGETLLAVEQALEAQAALETHSL